MSNNKNKIIVVGLDGATFTLLEPFIDEGRMPNLRNIMNHGASGILKSTIPPVTGPAWSSFATGTNPGKHGAYDFVVRDKNNKLVVINSTLIRGKKIWNILSDHEKKVGVIHFPISYPPEKVNGFMISGFISPQNANNITYPQELYAEILREVGDYIVTTKAPTQKKWRKFTKKEIKDYVDGLMREEELRYKTFKYLKNKGKLDFMYLLFMSCDKIQHRFWKYLDNNETDYPRGEIYEYILMCYQQIDDILGDLLKEMDEDTSLFIVSDHGFCSKKKLFHINVWLGRNGYLSKNHKKIIIEKIKTTLGFKNEKFFTGLPMPVVKVFNFLHLHKTKAYAPTTWGAGINLKKRDGHGIFEKCEEYNSIRNELKDKLLVLKDEETGKNFIKAACFPEEIYHGPYVKDVSDIILCPEAGYLITDSLISLSGRDLVKVTNSDGDHHPDGIFIALDKRRINNGIRVNSIDMIDIAPTILYLLGVPIPSEMDGKIVSQIFKDSFLESNSPVYYDSFPEEKKLTEERVYTEEDEKYILDSLKNLGYL